MKKSKKDIDFENHGTAINIEGMPETAFEMVNKYGTYNIQPTADTENAFPQIAQGYAGQKISARKISEEDMKDIK